MNQVVIYTKRTCPYCIRALELLDSKKVVYQEIRIDQHPEKRSEMEHRSQRKTVPQIFIGDTHVGGCDDLFLLEEKGELDTLLQHK